MLFFLSLLLFFTHFGSVNAMRAQPDALAQAQAAKRGAAPSIRTLHYAKKARVMEKATRPATVIPMKVDSVDHNDWWNRHFQQTTPSITINVVSLMQTLSTTQIRTGDHIVSTSVLLTTLMHTQTNYPSPLAIKAQQDRDELRRERADDLEEDNGLS